MFVNPTLFFFVVHRSYIFTQSLFPSSSVLSNVYFYMIEHIKNGVLINFVAEIFTWIDEKSLDLPAQIIQEN